MGSATACAPKNNKIMLVDDEEDITFVMQTGLQNHGFSVDAFNDSEQALYQFKPQYYNIVILDARMPKISGFDLAKQIWARDENAKICFLSAFEIYENEAKKVFTNFKTHYFIKKPITPSNLAKRIQANLLSTD